MRINAGWVLPRLFLAVEILATLAYVFVALLSAECLNSQVAERLSYARWILLATGLISGLVSFFWLPNFSRWLAMFLFVVLGLFLPYEIRCHHDLIQRTF